MAASTDDSKNTPLLRVLINDGVLVKGGRMKEEREREGLLYWVKEGAV